MLLDGGLDVNLAAADGATALLASLYNWDPPDTTFVPGKGAPAQAGSSQKFGPDLKMARFLLDRGATVKAADSAGYTPFSVMSGRPARRQGNDCARRRPAGSLQPGRKDPGPVEAITLRREKQTILHIAALGGSAPIIEYLVSQGARLDLKNATGETPLDLADQQERYLEAIQRQNADGDPGRLSAVKRQTATTDVIMKLLAHAR